MGVYITYTPRLPSEYQEVEYIEASGTQYIESGYIPNGNTKIASKFACTNTTTSNCPLFGAATSSGQNEYVLWTTTTSITAEDGHALFSAPAAWGGTAYVKELPKITPGDIIEFRYDKIGGKYGSTTWTRNLSGGSAGQNMLIFGLRRSGIESKKFKGKLYYFKIRDNGTLVRDLVPCYRKSDGVIGLYDLVNSAFYTNSGSGTFSKGNDVTMVEMKNAYIGEYIPMSGLLGYRPLQSDLKDESGNGNDGSWYIYSSGSGSFGTVGGKTGARVTKDSGDSSEHHIVTALNYSGPTVTMCGWVYYSSIQSSGRRPGVLTNPTSSSSYISLSPRPAQSNRWTVGGNGNLLTSTTSATTGTWYFVVGVLTSSGKKIYVNGTQIASDSTGFATGQGSIWRLGCGQLDNSRYGGVDGYVRHCAVYNRELTTDEILKYYNLTA